MRFTQLRKNEQGMAAILITMVLMIVISLIVLGFAQITRREQRQALDRQLVTQAYYAAESGVNLAQQRIAEFVTANPGVPVVKDECAENDGGILSGGDYVIDAPTETHITCLLISGSVDSLSYQDVSTRSIVANVESASPINEIVFSWEASSDANPINCPNTPTQLPPAGSWNCNQPLLRVDVVPLAANLVQADLQRDQFTRFFYPVDVVAAPGTAAYAQNSRSALPVVTRCVASVAPNRNCTARITGLNATRYGVRVQAIYGSATLDISAIGGGSQLALINGQLTIDATARANDILRRVQSRVSSTTSIVPDFGIASGGPGLCKRYAISGTNVTVDNTGGIDVSGC